MRTLAAFLARIGAIVLLAGIACSILVRYSPGSQVDERELNYRMGEDSLAALRTHQAQRANLAAVLGQYLRGLPHGELGYSESSSAPIAMLIRNRAPQTLRELAVGLSGSWLFGALFALAGLRRRHTLIYDISLGLPAGVLLSLPAALLAYFCVLAHAGPSLVVGLAVAPRIFLFLRNLLGQAYAGSHVAMARARGVGELRILLAHVAPSALPQVLALAAASVSMAIGTAIPVEAICDIPGLGRLAWNAAMARDLPLLVNLTMLVALVTSAAAACSELIAQRSGAPA